MKDKIWLVKKPKKGKWAYGLCRLENGMIVVGECYSHPSGFGVVGHSPAVSWDSDHTIKRNEKPVKLLPGERKRIIESLYEACCEELKKDK